MKPKDGRTITFQGRQFEKLLSELFELEGFTVSTEVSGGNMMYASDLVITSKGGTSAVVEGKLYSSRTMPSSAILDGIEVSRQLDRGLDGAIAPSKERAPHSKAKNPLEDGP